jgi:hypothetical protein
MATILTLLIVTGFAIASGGMIFSPGALNAQAGAPQGGDGLTNARAGAPIGGIRSHAEIAGKCSLCHAPFWSTSTMADRCVVCHKDVGAQLESKTPLHGTLHQNYPTLTCRDCHPDHKGPISLTTDLSDLGFAHNSFGFLLNTHQTKTDGSAFACADCHGTDYTSYDQTSCTSCHNQINATFTQSHIIDFGNACLACHDGADTYGKNFDHNTVSFQLSGKHDEVLCNQCHLNDRTSGELKATPEDCVSCHLSKDVHWGRLGPDCGSCHTTTSWGSASYNHNLAAFKLTGQHKIVECTNCHINHVLQGTPIACASCHNTDDVHKGRLGAECDSCHTTGGWTPATYDHNLSAFKLTGMHAITACANCHINHILQGTPTDCQSCHAGQDKHNGQFGADCSSCHSTNAWLPARFDHPRFGFTLTGAHINLTCGQCHSGGGYTGLSTACAACHAEPPNHFGSNCSQCHSTSNWNATFSHSGFSMSGAHANLACSACHTSGSYGGLSASCSSCHAEPANHFGSDCSQCHSTSNWNASFNHPGGCDGNCANHRNASCADCHPSGYSSATCLKCHSSNNPGN